MNVLARKLRRDIIASSGMLLAVVSIISFGIGSLVGFQATSNNLAAARDDYYDRCRMADFWIDIKKAPLSLVSELAATPGVEGLRGRIANPVIVDLPAVDAPISGLLISMPETRSRVINDVVVTAGSWFGQGHADQVIVSEQFANARGLRPGDSLDLIIAGQRKRLTVVGLGMSAEFVELMPPGAIAPESGDYGVFYVSRRFAEEALDMAGATNSVVGLLTAEGRADPAAVLERLSRRLAPYGVFATTPLAQQPSNLNLTSELAGLATMASMMPLIFLTVAALVLNVLMMRLAAQQRVIIGTLKALGYDNRGLFGHFVQVGVLVGLVGAVLGCLLGYGIGAALTQWYKAFFTFPSLPNRLYPGLMLAALVIALLFSVLGTLRGVGQVTRLSPAEAMHPSPPTTGGAIGLERWPWLWRRFGFFWQMALRAVFRNRARSLVSVFAAALGTAMLVSTFGMVDSLKYMVQFQFDKVMLADFTLNFRSELDGGALHAARRLPGVMLAEPLFYVAGSFEHANHRHKGSVVGLLPDATLVVPRNRDGSAVAVPEQGLLMAKRLAAQLHLEVGDLVRLTPSKGTQQPREVPVMGLVDSLFGLGVYADYRWLNALLGETSAISSIQLRTAQSGAERQAFLAELKRLPTLLSVQDLGKERASLWRNFVVKLGGMSYVMILFGAVIFFGAILNAALIGLIERRREMATYRVLGYRPAEIGAMYLRESLLLNLIGTLLGLPLGWWMLVGMNTQYANDLYVLPSVVTASGWVWSVLLAIGFVLIAQVLVQRQIDRMNWNEALSMKE